MRPAAGSRLAFVGDAALGADPLFGVGCGWAFQTAEWLAEETRSPVLDGGDLDRALRRYRRTVALRLGPHHMQMSDYSTGRPMRLNERLAMRAGGERPRCRGRGRGASPRGATRVLRLLDPVLTTRALLSATGSPCVSRWTCQAAWTGSRKCGGSR